MMHNRRTWCVNTVGDVAELAHKLTEQTWTLCSGFQIAGFEEYLFLNDSTCEDAAAEFAVIRGGIDSAAWIQVESITFSWCTYDRALELINQCLAGKFDQKEFAHAVTIRVQHSSQHGRCPLCA